MRGNEHAHVCRPVRGWSWIQKGRRRQGWCLVKFFFSPREILDLFSTPMTLTRDDSVKFEMGIPKLVVVVHLVISRCCFARSSKEMNARAQLLFCSLSGDSLVAVIVLICLSSLLTRTRPSGKGNRTVTTNCFVALFQSDLNYVNTFVTPTPCKARLVKSKKLAEIRRKTKGKLWKQFLDGDNVLLPDHSY